MKYLALLCLAACSGAPFSALEDRAPIELPDAAPDVEPDHVTPAPDAGAETATGDARAPDADAGHEPDTSDPLDTGVTIDAPDEPDPPDVPCPTHTNGAGQTFMDCTPLGMYTSALAMHAASVWFPGVGNAPVDVCCNGTPCTDRCVVRDIGTDCGVWGYSGDPMGHMTIVSHSCATYPDPTAAMGYPGWQ
jgi:hypothetical protein